jgi:hypothetical protein
MHVSNGWMNVDEGYKLMGANQFIEENGGVAWDIDRIFTSSQE